MGIKSVGDLLSRLADRAGSRQVDLAAIEDKYLDAPGRQDRCLAVFKAAMERAKLSKGRLLEIGGRRNPLKEHFPGFDYHALDIADGFSPDIEVIVADITKCPEIPDASYDAIISIDVFEHIDKPWLAASEITRILKPGGITAHSTLFSWRYHPCPIDYFRFSPEALKSLFPDLKHLHASFDYTERRRNVTTVSRRGEPNDELGGWRENVRVHYAGAKPRKKRTPPPES